MTNLTMPATRDEERVASYETPEAATKALSHLVALDYGAHDHSNRPVLQPADRGHEHTDPRRVDESRFGQVDHDRRDPTAARQTPLADRPPWRGRSLPRLRARPHRPWDSGDLPGCSSQ